MLIFERPCNGKELFILEVKTVDSSTGIIYNSGTSVLAKAKRIASRKRVYNDSILFIGDSLDSHGKMVCPLAFKDLNGWHSIEEW